jgi:hypothetical protein
MNRWWGKLTAFATTGVVGVLMGATVGHLWDFYSFHITQKVEMVRFANDLYRQFYDDPIFKKMQMSVERCEKMYTGWGGAYDNGQINRYLGFFDNLGFYWEYGILDYPLIDRMFGPYIIEAYEDDELRKYVDDAQRKTGQVRAFIDYQALARKLEENPNRKEMIGIAQRCSSP